MQVEIVKTWHSMAYARGPQQGWHGMAWPMHGLTVRVAWHGLCTGPPRQGWHGMAYARGCGRAGMAWCSDERKKKQSLILPYVHNNISQCPNFPISVCTQFAICQLQVPHEHKKNGQNFVPCVFLKDYCFGMVSGGKPFRVTKYLTSLLVDLSTHCSQCTFVVSRFVHTSS